MYHPTASVDMLAIPEKYFYREKSKSFTSILNISTFTFLSNYYEAELF